MTTLHDLPQHLCDESLAFHGKAKAAVGRAAGFGGEIVFLDNGEHVFPRFIAAKYPRKKSGHSLRGSAEAFLREMTLQAKAHYHPNVHWPFDLVMLLGVPVAYFRRWEGDLSAFIEDELRRGDQDENAPSNRMRIGRGCGGAGRSPEPT